jgi:hypothetical protein
MADKNYNVISSNIQKIVYDDEMCKLKVTFSSGVTYIYSNIPNDLFEKFIKSDSKGKFFSQNIKGKFVHSK